MINIQPLRAIRHSRGFTLMELMMVVAIIGVIVLITLPALSKLAKGNSQQQATAQVTAYMAGARATALGQRTPVAVIFYDDQVNGAPGGQTKVVLARFVRYSGANMIVDGIPGRPAAPLARGAKVATLDDHKTAGSGFGAGAGNVGANRTGTNARARVILFDQGGHLQIVQNISAPAYVSGAVYSAGQVVVASDFKTYTCLVDSQRNSTNGQVVYNGDGSSLAQDDPVTDSSAAYPTWQLTPWNLNDPTANGNIIGFSSPGVLVYDAQELNSDLEVHGYNNGSGALNGVTNDIKTWDDYISRWLTQHGDLLVVNAYTGNVVR